MKVSTRCCTTLIITLAAVATPAISADRLTMTIRVLDQAHLPAAKIQKMERYVENALASVQIDVNWVDCAANLTACQGLYAPNDFWLRILAQMPPRVNGGVDLLGFTQHRTPAGSGIQCVNVFYPMVEQMSARGPADSHQVLGATVVHEIGHLYLGTNGEAHSQTGVMCGAWSRREWELASIGELTFTREQSARIRALMTAASGL